MHALLLPPVAFTIYLALAVALRRIGPLLSMPDRPSTTKSSLYASGEQSKVTPAIPGYGPFLVIPLFFAVVHLGVLLVATSAPGGAATAFLGGLLVVLLVLILG